MESSFLRVSMNEWKKSKSWTCMLNSWMETRSRICKVSDFAITANKKCKAPSSSALMSLRYEIGRQSCHLMSVKCWMRILMMILASTHVPEQNSWNRAKSLHQRALGVWRLVNNEFDLGVTDDFQFAFGYFQNKLYHIKNLLTCEIPTLRTPTIFIIWILVVYTHMYSSYGIYVVQRPIIIQ